MTDNRPICPIPPDAKVGDIVVFRDGDRKTITEITLGADNYEVSVEGLSPGWVRRDGQNAGYKNHDYDCIAFEYHDGRKPNLPHTKKPKRTQAQRDAAWLRKLVSGRKTKVRLNQIADRMEGKT